MPHIAAVGVQMVLLVKKYAADQQRKTADNRTAQQQGNKGPVAIA